MDTPADVTLFLDVDGTIAPFGHDRPDTEWGAWAEHSHKGPPSWVAPSWFSTDMNRALFGMGLNTMWLSHWEGRTVDELNGRYGIPNGIGYLRRAEVPGGVKFGGDGPLGWWKARYEGTLRIEGKDYKVVDGDVMEFRFGVTSGGKGS